MQHAVPRDRLRLASHVRACECGRSVILLDLRRSRYLGVSGAVSKILADHVDGWPISNQPVGAAAPQDSISSAARTLLLQGLLTDEPVNPAPMITLEEASASVDVEASPTSRALGARRLLQFTGSVAVAAWWLRCRSLLAIANSLTARREQFLGPKTMALDAMGASVAAYEALRPFVFTAREKCLLDSIALTIFLARDGLFPHWVIGIKTRPFGAHSWVQSGGTVLNDQHGYVRQFRPILVV